MRVPHFLRYAKYRYDFWRRYIKAFGFDIAIQTYYATRRRNITPGTIVSIWLDCIGSTINLRAGTSDIATFEKIFVWRDYALGADGDVKGIIDCGANIGVSAVWFAINYPNARIIAIEPDEANYALLLENIGRFPNVVPLFGGVWNRTCRLIVTNPGARPDSYQFAELPNGVPEGVPAYDLETIRCKYGMANIDILKMDIEGGENVVFSGQCEEWLARTRMLLIELHSPDARIAVEMKIERLRHRHSRVGENDIYIFEPASRQRQLI